MAMRKAGYTPKKRNSYARKRSSIVLVATEGKNETETRYLKDFIAAQNGFRVLVSSPCFEIWFLCHYGASTKQYLSNEHVLDELRKEIPSYGKSKDKMFDLTKDKIEDAIRNAEKLRSACERAGYRPHTIDFLPSTEIDILAREIMKSEN